MSLTEKNLDLNKAKKEREKWKEKATYWHNSIPIFDHDYRSSLTKDVQTIAGIEQLELNQSLSKGIKWNNRINIIIGIINLELFVVNIILLVTKTTGI